VLVLKWGCLAREKGDRECRDVDHGGVKVSWKGGSCQSARGSGGLGVTTPIDV